MRAVLFAVMPLVLATLPAHAQYYAGNTCNSQPAAMVPLVGPFIARQQAEACLQQQRAAYEAQQAAQQADQHAQAEAEQARQAAEQARSQAEARRVAADQARQQAREAAAIQHAQEEASRQAAIQADLADRQAAAEAVAETTAENSPDNYCRTPAVAAGLLKQYASLMSLSPEIKVIDIQHLVTIKHDETANIMVCHGTWLLSNGETDEGTLTIRPNVAQEMISQWKSGHWAPPIDPVSLPQPAAPPPVPAIAVTQPASVQPSDSFERGTADRQAWEAWFGGLSGDYQRGAFFWAGQRSLARPEQCKSLSHDAALGCIEAKARLTLPDFLRKSDQDYRHGWNSYQPASSTQATN